MSTIPSVLIPRTFARLDNFHETTVLMAGHLSTDHGDYSTSGERSAAN
jgi:hypothetical protein